MKQQATKSSKYIQAMLKRKTKLRQKFGHRICVMMLLVGFICSSSGLRPQPPPLPEYKLKAVFLFNFTRFVNWPDDAFTNNNAPFVIAILGNDPFGSYIDEVIAGEKFGTHPLIVKRYNSAAEIRECQMLFVSSNELHNLKNILDELEDRSVLTVSDVSNFTSAGGMISLITVNEKIKLQINSKAARRAGLIISSKLLRIAEDSR